MTNHLVIAAIGVDRPGTVEKLSSAVFEYECNIEDSRMAVLGGTFAQIVLVAGKWNNLAKLESALAALQTQLELTITTRRTQRRELGEPVLSYSVDVVSMDHPGIVSALAAFFSARGINIHDMATSTYHAAHTATPMFSVHMSIEIPAQLHISRVREEFLDLCDTENLDGVIEPFKL